MYSCRDSFISEFDSPMVIHHYWSLSSQLIPYSSHRALVYSHADAEVWSKEMDRVMGEDATETSVKLRLRASKHGGRPSLHLNDAARHLFLFTSLWPMSRSEGKWAKKMHR